VVSTKMACVFSVVTLCVCVCVCVWVPQFPYWPCKVQPYVTPETTFLVATERAASDQALFDATLQTCSQWRTQEFCWVGGGGGGGKKI